MNRILFIIIVYALPSLAFGKSDLTKQEKAIVKALKKQYKLENVDVKHPYSGFTYYELQTKDYKQMIADSTGIVIIPKSKQTEDAYQNIIKFVGGHTKGYSNYRERGGYTCDIPVYYPGNEPVFIAYNKIGGGSNEYEFISVSDEVLNTFDGSISESYSAPVNICKDMAGNFGVMTMDGRMLLPCEYSTIEVRPDGICTLTQMHDGMERMGGACISDMTESKVPCNFYYVDYSPSGRCWKVQIHDFDSLMVYDESKQYDTSFLDDGQRLFEQQQYEKARKYYTLTGNEAKWAKFYIGASYKISAQRLYDEMNDALKKLEGSSNRQDRHIATDFQSNMGLLKSDVEKAEKAFQDYIESGHTKYAVKAKELLYEMSEMLAGALRMEGRLDLALADFDRRCDDLERREQEKYNRHLEQQQLNLERQRLHAQRLAREQRERDLQMRQRTEAERRQREAKKREEERRKAQQNQLQRKQPVQQLQRKSLEQRKKDIKRDTTTPTVPRKKSEVK